MSNSISDFYTDEELISNLRPFFEDNEMWNINFQSLLKQIEEHNDIYFILRIKNRIFYIDKISGEVMEK